MTLLELCEPLFLYICRLNRSARKGRSLQIGHVREEVKEILASMKARAASDIGLTQQFEKAELPLIFFVDSMIEDSDLGFAKEWASHRLAKERNELAGDDRFFELLDETLADPSEAANERLAVLYTCLGLGFTGAYVGDHKYLRRKMMEMASRTRKFMETDESARICPEAYQNVDTRSLIEPPGRKLIGIAIALVGMIIVLFIANFYLFRWTSDDLTKALQTVVDRGTVAAKAKAGPSDTTKASKREE
jgi:type IV/VI secretion system ImpK/VasF family protein